MYFPFEWPVLWMEVPRACELRSYCLNPHSLEGGGGGVWTQDWPQSSSTTGMMRKPCALKHAEAGLSLQPVSCPSSHQPLFLNSKFFTCCTHTSAVSGVLPTRQTNVILDGVERLIFNFSFMNNLSLIMAYDRGIISLHTGTSCFLLKAMILNYTYKDP